MLCTVHCSTVEQSNVVRNARHTSVVPLRLFIVDSDWPTLAFLLSTRNGNDIKAEQHEILRIQNF